MMNCAENHRLLHAYVDGELDLVRSLEVEQHLHGCAACAAQNRSLGSLHSALHSVSLNYTAPRSLRRAVRELGAKTETRPTASRVPWFWPWLTTGVTAFALLLLLMRPTGLSESELSTNEMVANHVRSLMPGHLTDVISSDQHTVKPWFNGKLDFSPEVKDFAAQGFPLVGGRLEYLHGQTVAALVYRRNQHLINIYVWPANSTDKTLAGTEDHHGYHLISRDLNGLHYCLVSDLNPADLSQLADLIGK